MMVAVYRVESPFLHGTISVGYGVNEEGEDVRFAGDWRPMSDIAEAVEAGERPMAEVPSWAILSVSRKAASTQ
jgi:hypothetical protein